MSVLNSWPGRPAALKTPDRARLRLESLEPRAVPAIVTVTNRVDVDNGDTTSIAALVADDGGDGISLREALVAANKTAGLDEIRFDIANYDQTIILGEFGVMPEITDALIVNGAHRPADKFYQRIILDGSGLPRVEGHGLTFAGGSSGSRVWGLGFTGFFGNAIQMYAWSICTSAGQDSATGTGSSAI